MATVRADTSAVLTIAHTEFVFMLLVCFAFLISLQLNDCVKSRLERLSVLAESAL